MDGDLLVTAFEEGNPTGLAGLHFFNGSPPPPTTREHPLYYIIAFTT